MVFYTFLLLTFLCLAGNISGCAFGQGMRQMTLKKIIKTQVI